MEPLTDKPLNMGFRGDRIRELRKEQAMSQEVLAEKVRSTQPTIGRIENGEGNKRPDRSLAVRIARALKVPLAEIFEETEVLDVHEPQENPTTPAPFDTKAYEAALLRVVDAEVHDLADLDRTREALREMLPLLVRPLEPDQLGRAMLDAARVLRVAGQPATPLAIVAQAATEALRRESAQAHARPPIPPPRRKTGTES